MQNKTKVCPGCRKRKDLTKFSIRKNPNKTEKIYHLTFCKECMVKKTKKWVKENRDKYNDYQLRYWHAKRSKK